MCSSPMVADIVSENEHHVRFGLSASVPNDRIASAIATPMPNDRTAHIVSTLTKNSGEKKEHDNTHQDTRVDADQLEPKTEKCDQRATIMQAARAGFESDQLLGPLAAASASAILFAISALTASRLKLAPRCIGG